jgi:hypothetical protein
MCEATIGKFFDGEIHDHDRLIESFNKHIETVKAVVPPERLLIYRVKQGWQPLCRFLGLTIPDEPFPHANREQETKDLMEGAMLSKTEL